MMTKYLYYNKCKLKYHGWADNEAISNAIWEAFEGKLNIVIFDSSEIDLAFYEEKLEYYRETYDEQEKIGSLDYGDMPKFKVLGRFDLFPNSNTFGVFYVINPFDAKSVEGIMTFTSGDEELHLFSGDFLVSEIENLFIDYAKDAFCKNGTPLAEYFLETKKMKFLDKTLCMIDTYSDDEDSDHYYVITNRKEIYNRLCGNPG